MISAVRRNGDGKMEELTKAIVQARALEELLPLLESLTVWINRIVRSRDCSPSDMISMCAYLSGIRATLQELELQDGTTPALRALVAQYLELEGKIKELRNDLHCSKKGLTI